MGGCLSRLGTSNASSCWFTARRKVSATGKPQSARYGLRRVNAADRAGLEWKLLSVHGKNFPLVAVDSPFVLIGSAFTSSGLFLSGTGSPIWVLTTCSSCDIKDRKA